MSHNIGNVFLAAGMALTGLGVAFTLNHKQPPPQRREEFVEHFFSSNSDPLKTVSGEPNVNQSLLYPEKCTLESCTRNKLQYWVQPLENSVKAADLLAEMHEVGQKLYSFCKREHIFSGLIKRWPKVILFEALPEKNSHTTSFTMSKQRLGICLRDRNLNLHTNHELMYVFIHEVAHLACEELQHTELFWVTFRIFQTIARAHRWWNPPNLNAFNFDYCVDAMKVRHKLPPSYDPTKKHFRELITDIQNNHGAPPIKDWKNDNGGQNPILQSIISDIPPYHE